MERSTSILAPSEQRNTLASLYTSTSPLLDLDLVTSTQRPLKFVGADVDGAMFPDGIEFTGAMMNFMYENDLFNENTATQIKSGNKMLRVTARQAYEALGEQYEAEKNSKNLQERQIYFKPLNIMHDAQIKGRRRSEVDTFADEVIKQRLSEMYRPVAEEIDMYKDDGVYIGLISGSPDFLIQSLKRALGLDIATGTQLRKSGEGRYHPTAPTSPRGRDKHVIANGMMTRLSLALMSKQGKQTTVTQDDGLVRLMRPDEIEPENRIEFTAMYGDTTYDQSAMELAKDPVVVYELEVGS